MGATENRNVRKVQGGINDFPKKDIGMKTWHVTDCLHSKSTLSLTTI